MLTLAAAVPLLIWVYLLLGRGQFWRVRPLVSRAAAAPARALRVAAVVPARNEADVVGRAVTSLLQQLPPDQLDVILVDDASTDGTAEVARQAAARLGRSQSFTLIQGEPLPPGWTGKLWAMQQGIDRARRLTPDFLLFTDADIAHAPGSIAGLAALAESASCDLASLMVRLQCATPAEKLLIPAFVFFFLMLYPARWIDEPRARTAGAAGGCILVRPAALERAGGLAAIGDQIIDDCALAAAVKRSGGRLWLGLAAASESLRPYGSAGEIARMIARSAFSQLRHSAVLLAASMVSMLLAFLLAPVLLFCGALAPVVLAAAAIALMAACYLPMVRFYRLHPLWTLALPLAALFYMGATVRSALDFWRGRGGAWKGRVQDPLRVAATTRSPQG